MHHGIKHFGKRRILLTCLDYERASSREIEKGFLPLVGRESLMVV
jgi:hypothetical protein